MKIHGIHDALLKGAGEMLLRMPIKVMHFDTVYIYVALATSLHFSKKYHIKFATYDKHINDFNFDYCMIFY